MKILSSFPSSFSICSVTTFSLFTYLIHVSLVYAALLLLTSFTLCAAFPFTPVSYAAFPYSLTLVSYTRCLSSILLLHSWCTQPRFHIYINYYHSRVFFSSLFVQSSCLGIPLLYPLLSQLLKPLLNLRLLTITLDSSKPNMFPIAFTQTFEFIPPTSILEPAITPTFEQYYPPPILTKHPVWYLLDANFFISIWGVSYGLHWRYFQNPPLSQEIVTHGENQLVGLLPWHPIPFDILKNNLFDHFIVLLYHGSFKLNHLTKDNWINLKQLCVDWYFPGDTLVACIDTGACNFSNLPLINITEILSI